MTIRRVRVVLLSLVSLLAVGSGAVAQMGSRSSALESLVAAERSFAKASVERGMREAFLANLGDDAVIFRPGPVSGRAWFEQNPPSRAYLSWEPVLADVATSGELGFTTGPYELRPQGSSDTTRRYGHYVTLWKRLVGGPWKVAIDIGTFHPKPAARILAHRESEGRAFPDGAGARTALLRTDSTLGSAGGTAAAQLVPRLAADVWLLRVRSVPAIGMTAARVALQGDTRTYRSQPTDGTVAASGDFAYTYGEYNLASSDASAAERGDYLRIWRRTSDGNWIIVLDLVNPRP